MNRDDRLLRLPEVALKIGLGRSTIYRKLTDRTFPQPVRVGQAAIRWRESDVAIWMAALAPDTHSRR